MSDAQGRGTALLPGSRLRRVKGIAWRMIEGEAVLVNVRGDEVMHLNPSASFLWSRLDGEATLEDIARAMTEEFEVEMEEALSDTLGFAALLAQKGVAELV